MSLTIHVRMIPKNLTRLRLPEQPNPSHLLPLNPISPIMINPRIAVNSRSLTTIDLRIVGVMQSTMLRG